MSKPEVVPKRLEVLNRINLQLSADNALLQEQIAELERRLRSPQHRYAARLVNELLWGSPRAKAAFVSDALDQAVRCALQPKPLLERARTGGLRLLCDRVLLPGQEQAVTWLLQPSECRKIVLSLAGGLGDGLWLTAVATAIRHKYVDAEIYILSPNALFRQVYAGNACVRGVLTAREASWGTGMQWLMQGLLRDGRLDLWYECKYVTKVHYGERARVAPAERARTDAAFAEHHLNFDDEFPSGNNLVSAYCARQGMNLFDLIGRTALLDLSDPQLCVVPTPADLQLAELHGHLGDYVTIHHGCDVRMAGSQARPQTKNWHQERWESVIASLTARTGVKVVQIGTANEAPLRGAIHSFLGRTSVNEAGVLIKNARLHLDTEGGMVHLARAVHTPALVLFGPTALSFFAYPGNRNLREGDCHDCWWSTQDWYQRCPRGLATPACMDAIRTEQVSSVVTELLGEQPLRARQELRDFTLKGGSPDWERSYAVEQIRSLPAEGPLRVLHAGSGEGALSLDLATAGHQVEICALNFADDERRFLQAAAQRGIRFRFGALFNLPYESDTFDVVCCVPATEHLRVKSVVLPELLRVLRPGGLLVLTFALPGEEIPDSEARSAAAADLYTALGLERDEIRRFGAVDAPPGVSAAGLCVIKREVREGPPVRSRTSLKPIPAQT